MVLWRKLCYYISEYMDVLVLTAALLALTFPYMCCNRCQWRVSTLCWACDVRYGTGADPEGFSTRCVENNCHNVLSRFSFSMATSLTSRAMRPSMWNKFDKCTCRICSCGIECSFDKDQGKRNWFISGKIGAPNYRVPVQEETIGHKKKEYRRTPTFVNLKSNTMKNTMQS